MLSTILDYLSIFIGFRKFFIMFLALVVSLLLLLFHILTGAEWVDLQKAALVAYFASNGIEHFAQAARDWLASKSEVLKKL